MSNITLPFDFLFYAFDYFHHHQVPFEERWEYTKNLIYSRVDFRTVPHKQEEIYTPTDLDESYQNVIVNGEEGLILRDPDAPYKQGRSTYKQEWMLKMKAFEESEGKIIGYEQEYKNNNEQTQDQTGAKVRSHHKQNLQPLKRIGNLLLEDASYPGQTIRVGSGFSQALKEEIYETWPKYKGQIATYTFQPHGEKDSPRHPVFKGIRKD